MLDIKRIKENPDAVKAGLKAKEVDCDATVDKILVLDERIRALKTASEGKEFFSPIYIGAYAYEFFKSRHPVRAARYAQIVTLLARAANGNLEYTPSKADIEKYMAENKIDLNRNSF